jgi:hypothetical protein
MRGTLNRLFIALAFLGFLTLVWANRSGKFVVKSYDWGGKFTEITDSTPANNSSIPVRVGIFAENVYDFNSATQSFAAEGLVWAHWGQKFQELLDREGVTIDQVISPSNRVNSWDWMMRPFYPKPLRTSDGGHYQLVRFAGRFYIHDIDYHRFPFERITFPIVFGLNSMSDVFSAEKVRLVPDKQQSGVGPFIDIVGYATDTVKVSEFLQTNPSSFGYKSGRSDNSSDFSQVWLQISYKKSGFASLLQLILPLLIVMLITLVTPNLAASLWDVRIAIPSTALLTLVFLQQSYRQTLPFLPYVTYLDQIYVASYIVTFTLFCLFVWTSNNLEAAPEAERAAVIKRMSRADAYVQGVCLVFLIGSTVLNWFFPIHF